MGFQGIFRQYDVEPDLSMEYVPNRLFVGLNDLSQKSLESGVFSVQVHPDRMKVIDTYRTVWRGIAHSGVVYKLSVRSMSLALYRMFHDKFASDSESLVDRRARQHLYFRSAFLRGYATSIRNYISGGGISGYPEDRNPPISLWVDKVLAQARLPHPKRQLRLAALNQLDQSGRLLDHGDDYSDDSHRVRFQLKTREWAKPGKIPRITVDLTTPASLRAGWLMEELKSAFEALPLIHANGELRFIGTPNVDVLSKLFDDMRNRNIFAYFSDDFSLSLMTSDGPLWVNLDISSCDSSNGFPVFDYIRSCIPQVYLEDVGAVINQCQLECVVGYGATKLRFKPVGIFEYSGSVMTTALNNCAALACGVAIFDQYTFGSRSHVLSGLERVLSTLPWVVTTDVCSRYEEVQFLKHSPCFMVDGTVSALLNLGVVLRAFGQCYGDLPGTGSLEQRAFDFDSSLVRGLVHVGDCMLMQTLRAKYNSSVSPDPYLSMKSLGSHRPHMDESSVCSRYALSVADMQELCDLLEMQCFGEVVSCHASRVILAKDYGF